MALSDNVTAATRIIEKKAFSCFRLASLSRNRDDNL